MKVKLVKVSTLAVVMEASSDEMVVTLAVVMEKMVTETIPELV